MHKLCIYFIVSVFGFLEVDSWVVWYKPFFSPLEKFSFIFWVTGSLILIDLFMTYVLAPENPQRITYVPSICVDTALDRCSLKMLPVLVSECFTQAWLTCHTFLPQWPPTPQLQQSSADGLAFFSQLIEQAPRWVRFVGSHLGLSRVLFKQKLWSSFRLLASCLCQGLLQTQKQVAGHS